MSKLSKKSIVMMFLLLFGSVALRAQDVAVKTNLLYDAALTVN